MNTNNSSNNNSDLDLLDIRNGWLDIKKESVKCNCIICQSTIAVNTEKQGNPSYELPFLGDSSTETNNCGIPYVDEQNIQRLRTFSIPPVDYGNTFKLNSNPNAKQTIYLDFNGHITEGTSWKNGARIESPAYDTDGNVNSFSDIEKEEIQKIWQRVAEDFAPFNVNITTEEPKDIEDLKKTGTGDERWGIRVVLTQDKDTQIAPGSGGVAYVGSFNSENDTPAFAFNKGENNAALTISHEVGHALGLSHDGILPSTAYHPGFGSGDTTWGPIMGAPFGKNITQWSKGDYYLADNTGSNANYGSGEDDLKIITTQNGFGYRVDDYGNNNSTAFKLAPDNTNTVSSFGIIERNTDIDVFSFLTGAGNVSFNINPSSRTYISDGSGNYTLQYLSSRGANLDIWARLYKADGTLIAESNPVDSLFASFNLFLSAGEYYIHVDGIGKGNPFSTTPDGYTDYGSLGQYEIKGTVVAAPNDIVGIAPVTANKNEEDSGTTNFTFNLTRSGDTSAGTTVNWQVTTATNNSADASDFVGGVLPKGTITFAAGETSRQITVEIRGDENVELDENFVVKLSNLSRGTLAPDAAIGTILSDDAEIRGVKWYDSNQNGVKDGNEPGLANWTIFIDKNQNGLLDSGEISTTTGTDGSYTFSNVTPGTYSISEALQSGWKPTFPKQLQGQETYKLDDGAGTGLAYSHTGDVAVFNIFETAANFETLNFISVGLGSDVNPTKLFIYQDLNGNKIPDGNEKRLEVATNFTATNGFATVAIEPTTVSGTFFIGALYPGNSSQSTWFLADYENISVAKTRVALQTSFNPSNFSTFGTSQFYGMIRAHSGAIPQQVTVNGGDIITGLNFGNYRENTPPVGNNDAVTINEDSSTSGNVLSNDTDIQNDTLTVIEVNSNTANVGSQITLTSGALLTLNADGKFSYNPNGKFESLAAVTTVTDSFTYKVSDGKGGTNTATATITINGVNDKPVLGNAIANQAATENVGFSFTIPANTFSDIDNGDNLTYTVTKADGSTLPTWLTFNPTKREFSGNPGNSDVGVIEIKVTVTDSGNESVSDIFALNVGNVNNPPQLNTNTLTISEGGTVSLSSGNLSATDIDNNNASLKFTISNIIGGEFQVDGVVKSSFTQQQITNDKVKFIHNGGEIAPSYYVTVSDGSLTDTSKVSVSFTNVNDAPTNITLSNTSVSENNAAEVIGNLTVTDVDSSNFTYQVNDNRFEVVNSQLKLKSGISLDFETTSSINLEITANDDGNPSQGFTKGFALTVGNVNEAPTNITLSNTSVAENNTAAVIGNLTVTDVDSSNLTYQVNDNRFEVVNSQLKLKSGVSLDFETTSSINLEITATDDGTPTQSFSKKFAIAVTNVNEAPTDIALSNTSVAENNTAAVIGNLTVTDVDSSNFTYTLNDNRFEVVNNQLKLKSGISLDFETTSSINLEITATDDGTPSQSFTKGFTLTVTNVNEAPTNIALSNTSVAENNTAAVIGNLTVTDVDSSNFTYQVNDNRFEVVNNQLKLKSGVSLDFETTSSINLEITATDDGTPTQSFSKKFAIAVIDVSDTAPKLNKGNNDIFTISGGNDKPKLSVTLLGHNSNLVNELGVFVVDDEQGTINGIAPGKEGYPQAALERSKILFSAISNPPNGFNQNDLNSLVEFNSGNKLGFFLFRNSTIDAVRSGITPISEVLFSQPSTQKVELLEDGKYLISWEDGIGHSTIDFKDLVVQAQANSQPLPIGAKLQGNSQGELIDLRDITGQVRAEFVVNREAAFDNLIGFYKIADVNGGIDFDGNGTIDIRPGDTGYTQAALRGRVAGLDMSVMNQGTATFTTNLDGGSIYAPFIVANGKPEALLDNNPKNDPAVYFAFSGANPGRFDHIRLLGNNTWGFEDLPLGGDMDYNDVVIRANLRSV